MGGQIQFWFDFASTYSYLSAMRITEAARAQGVTVAWQPFLLGPIFQEQGWTTSPFNMYPAKGRYMWRDMQRLCDARGLPFVRPEVFPQNSLNAARLALAIDAPEQRASFTRAVYNAEFGAGRDISDMMVLADCLKAAGLPKAFSEQAQNADIKRALFNQVETAKTLDLFGAPSFIANDTLFWGDDRLDLAISQATQI